MKSSSAGNTSDKETGRVIYSAYKSKYDAKYCPISNLCNIWCYSSHSWLKTGSVLYRTLMERACAVAKGLKSLFCALQNCTSPSQCQTRGIHSPLSIKQQNWFFIFGLSTPAWTYHQWLDCFPSFKPVCSTLVRPPLWFPWSHSFFLPRSLLWSCSSLDPNRTQTWLFFQMRKD